MLPDAGPLRKILELEKTKCCQDTAVMGGLDRFLRNWVAKVAASIDSRRRSRFRKLFLNDTSYASLSLEERRKWVEQVLAFVGEPEPAKAPGKVAATPKRAVVSPPPKPTVASELDSPVTVVRGISTAMAAKFAKLGVKTLRDLLYFFPHRHLDYSRVKTISQLREGQEETIIANVWEARIAMPGGRRSTEAVLGDETGNVRAVWFNQPYLAKKLQTNTRIVVSGRVGWFRGRPVFESPEWEPMESQDLVHTARLVPVYPLTEGLYPRQVRKLMKGVVDEWSPRLPEFLPTDIKKRSNLLDLPAAIGQAHYPDSLEMKDRARVRLAFDELFILQLGVMAKKRHWQESQPGNPMRTDVPLPGRFIAALPFKLTRSQERVLKEILADLRQARPMSRLLQGEVGSGKTVIALAALLIAVANGFQGALMAPTEILAEQHFATISGLLGRVGQESVEGNLRCYTGLGLKARPEGLLERPLALAVLTGEASLARKSEVQAAIANGEVDIVIGTHALIQKGVGFHKLGLAVVDEQHRFGVEQRSSLRQKGFSPHVLVMTATPIPRTLALTLYGDLDLSIIDELPPGRQSVKTRWLRPEQRASAYAFIRKQAQAGRQAFIICPLIEASESVMAQAAVAEHDRLMREVFPDLTLGLLHGRMSAADKDEVMAAFRTGRVNILVSTPVIEVGIDVPNATVMLIESADRFGLSQLHQFRGRVGRGKEQSYCMLLADNPTEVGRARLDIIEHTQDGFLLAEEDLKLRGPGEFFGTRQSGLPDLRMAKLSDVAILELARREATALFDKDPELTRPEHKPLAQEVARVWPRKGGEWS